MKGSIKPTASAKPARTVLTVIMDGIGLRAERFGNAVAMASKPNLDFLMASSVFTTLKAHGTAVGLPSDTDIGNSEVGHNALGAGRIFDQGAKLVQRAIDSGELFAGPTWKKVIGFVQGKGKTLHFIGLLSDGNVHSHEQHLFRLIEGAKRDGIKRVRLHVLLDGRDVSPKSAEIYLGRLQEFLGRVRSENFDIQVASGGGRMVVTMDRYEADWQVVRAGWLAHVEGAADLKFKSIEQALQHFRKDSKLTDQYFPPFIIVDKHGPVGTIDDGDGVVFFNFRGDRAVEISRAFEDRNLNKFPRSKIPQVFYAGMMQYDGDLKIPINFLVRPPTINDTLTDYFCKLGVRQFACSETQKYGHVTYFWNGNRSGKVCPNLEEYVEIPSDNLQFDMKPQMKAREIADVAIDRIERGTFEFGRINFANGDMVGHTGNFDAAVVAVETVDQMLGRLIKTAEAKGVVLIITADHGNCDEMFESGSEKDYPNWLDKNSKRPLAKTAHTLSPVPLFIHDPKGQEAYRLVDFPNRTLGNIAATVLEIMQLPPVDYFLPSLIKHER